MKLLRVIEEFDKMGEHIKTYRLNIDAKTILKVLPELKLYEDDFEDEIYDCYDVTKQQLVKLKPYLTDDIILCEDNIYELRCYEDND